MNNELKIGSEVAVFSVFGTGKPVKSIISGETSHYWKVDGLLYEKCSTLSDRNLHSERNNRGCIKLINEFDAYEAKKKARNNSKKGA